MSFKSISTESKGFDRQLVPEGVYIGVIAHLIDWGTQEEEYEGQKRKRRVLRVGFVLPDVPVTIERDGQTVTEPAMLSKFYTLSLDPKSNLHKDLSIMLNRSLKPNEDITQLVGLNVQLSVVHKTKANGDTMDKIQSLMPLVNGMAQKEIDKSMIKMLDLDDFDKAVFESLGEREQEKIKEAPEYTPF